MVRAAVRPAEQAEYAGAMVDAGIDAPALRPVRRDLELEHEVEQEPLGILARSPFALQHRNFGGQREARARGKTRAQQAVPRPVGPTVDHGRVDLEVILYAAVVHAQLQLAFPLPPRRPQLVADHRQAQWL